MDERGFVIFSMPRTGSNMVVAMLRTHPDIDCLSGVFSDKGWTHWRSVARVDAESETAKAFRALGKDWNETNRRIEGMSAFLNALLGSYKSARRIGFTHHMGPPDRMATDKLCALGWPSVILRRENVLASYSSNKIVALTGQGSLRPGMKKRTARAEFHADEFDRFLNSRNIIYDYWTERIERSAPKSMTIDYSEARTREGMERIVGFLDCAPGRLGEWQTAKRNPDRMRKRFSNPDDLERFLRERDLTHWLHED